ncbi:MAG: ASKHA domain-containing protein, partial [Thermoguttaceae bacterium]|nr:ASKHA domain-containing protein [Thermoguttaceae bacterium]
MSGYRVRFLPDERDVVVDEGKTLLDAARQAGVYVEAVCGGDGTCGKCRLVVREGEIDANAVEFFTRDEIRRGYVLACRTRPRGDLVVEVPPESRLTGYVGIAPDSERFRDFGPAAARPPETAFDPLVQKHYFELPVPTLDDPTADQERLVEAISKRVAAPLQMGLKTACELPFALRRLESGKTSWAWHWEGRVTATVGLRGSVHEVLFVERGDTSQRNFGLALDVGTTTVVAHLVDLRTGAALEAAAKYNSQIQYGEDVISRINHARRPGGAEALHRAVIQDVETLIEDLVKRTDVGRSEIHAVVASGNTVMLHFLLGLQTDLIRLTPFIPVAASPPPIRAAEVGLRIHPRGILYSVPMVGSYVGGDIVAGILISEMHRSDELAMLLDIGTNGEVVLGNRDFLMACSASAGPAFEGASISCGMRAASGAIDKVRISRRGPAVSVTTVDGRPPLGLCGTGLIDALAGMFLAGIVDRAGRLQPDVAGPRFRTNPDDGQPEFLLVPAEETQCCRDLVLRQSDLENLVRTKGSIYAAADSLVQSVGLSFADVKRIYIAGAFGNRLDLGNCIAIGLLPDVPLDRIRFIGNSSVAGA